MTKHLPLLLFIGLASGQTGLDELIIKKGKKNIKFKTNQKLVVNSSIEGMFKEIISDDLVISTKNSIDENKITKLHTASLEQAKTSLKDLKT